MNKQIENGCFAGSLLPQHKINQLITSWLDEDIPNFDFGGGLISNKPSQAYLYMKSEGVFCGTPFVNAIFKKLNCKVDWLHKEGNFITPEGKEVIAIVEGAANEILLGERLALNCISRASGVATISRKYLERAAQTGWKGKVAASRKTTPGFRMVEKYAVLVGGADTHRYNLCSMVMLKDNHIKSHGSISDAILKAKSLAGFSQKIEVECRNTEEAFEAATYGADIVMLDNFSPNEVKETSTKVKNKFKNIIVEASGGITYENLSLYCYPDVDIISSSKLVQGYPCVDFSLKIET